MLREKVSYGSLIGNRRFNTTLPVTGTGWDMKITPDAPLKNYKDYKIVGQPVPRVDLPPKFTGEFTYTHDVRLPGMLHGRVVRPPVVNSQPTSVDESSIRNIAGVVKIVREGRFIGVVAETEWAAIQAAGALKVTWAEPTTKLPETPDALYDYLKNTKSFRDASPVNRGNPDAALSQAAKTFEATYRWPFQIHGMLGPSCAVADVRGDKVTIYAGSQGPFRTRGNVARLLGVPETNVRVIYREGSGCYGRLSPDDAPEDAALMSRAVGKPVRVQWSRADEHGWSPKGPAHWVTARAGVDSQGKLIAWDYMDRSQPWSTSGTPLLASQQVGLKPTGQGNPDGATGGGELYDIPNQKAVAASIPWIHEDPSPLRTSNLRAPGDLARTFASESFVDEIASALSVDPVEFRLRHLTEKRALDVLHAATRAANWQSRPSPAPPSQGNKATRQGIRHRRPRQRQDRRRGRSGGGQIHRRSHGQAHRTGARLRPDHQSRRAAQPDRGQRDPGREPHAAGRSAVRRSRSEESRLGQLSGDPLQRCPASARRVDQPPGDACAGRRRTGLGARAGGHRQCCL